MDNKRIFSPGDHVIFNGIYPGTVICYYSEGMIEVQGERGSVCIPEEDARLDPPNPKQTADQYMIYDAKTALWWSNKDGWGYVEDADIFTAEEKQRLNLPIGGQWTPSRFTVPPARYYLTYRNQGKTERTPAKYDNETDAYACAGFLKFQGATAVRVHQEK